MTKTKILLSLTIISILGLSNSAYPEKIDYSIYNLDQYSSITRGIGKIGDYSINENLMEFNKNINPTNMFDTLNSFKILKNKTRGLSGEGIYSKYSKSVVLVINDENQSTGSGSIIMKDRGIVLTNWHVVQGSEYVGVIFKSQKELKDSDVYEGKVIGYNATKDLAIIQIQGQIPDNINELKLSDKYPDVGSDVHAIGHPGSLAWTYTKGYVSQVRPNYEWNYKETAHKASIIQTQTPISPGNSGGPLISDDGKLLGVNSFKASGENLNFAVSSLEVLSFLRNIETHKKKEAKRRPVKKIKKASKNIDSDKDGIIDTILLDSDDDGIFDSVIVDEDQNGVPELVGRDTNQDGNVDIWGHDRDQNGHIDLWSYDDNEDGEVDAEGIDTDGDGKPDKFRKV
jgi:S1-C subfamily serine protease